MGRGARSTAVEAGELGAARRLGGAPARRHSVDDHEVRSAAADVGRDLRPEIAGVLVHAAQPRCAWCRCLSRRRRAASSPATAAERELVQRGPAGYRGAGRSPTTALLRARPGARRARARPGAQSRGPPWRAVAVATGGARRPFTAGRRSWRSRRGTRSRSALQPIPRRTPSRCGSQSRGLSCEPRRGRSRRADETP
jgi:hypothetical protein